MAEPFGANTLLHGHLTGSNDMITVSLPGVHPIEGSTPQYEVFGGFRAYASVRPRNRQQAGKLMTFPQVEAFRGGDNLIRVVGHRGARGVLPENSMIGFDFSLAIGVPLLEFDVVLTADVVPVITHNHRLHAPTFRDASGVFLTGEEPKVSSLTLEQIQQFDIGRLDGQSAYGRRFPDQAQLDGVRVPMLQDLLDLVTGPKYGDACLMLELKSDPDMAHDAAYREKFVGRVLHDVRSVGLSSRVVLHSFDWNLLGECQRQAPDLPSSYLTQLPENSDDVGEDSSKAVCPDFRGRREEIPNLVKTGRRCAMVPVLRGCNS